MYFQKNGENKRLLSNKQSWLSSSLAQLREARRAQHMVLVTKPYCIYFPTRRGWFWSYLQSSGCA